ncbi:MAG: TIGR04013 family B12-binding domain/radical SAM domain-containing protein [Methanomicrobiales archaeon]|nr:TIGR04013 family B12-binding domain/radical SAM domain-containing protein [Methanomicrobiales archaeon]
MRVNWRESSGTNNSFAALYAACEKAGYELIPTKTPEEDVTCYSLNSINVSSLRDEIAHATCITIAGGPHATACYHEVASFTDYVVVGEGERTLPRLLACIESGARGVPPGVATKDTFHPAEYCVILNAFPPFSTIKGYIEISRGCPFHCGYCQTPRIFGHRMRHRSIDTIVQYAARYRDVRFVSPNAFAYGTSGHHPDTRTLEILLRKIRGRIYFGTFPGEVRPECIIPPILDLVVQYCANTKIHFGAQSGSDAVLAALRRGHATSHVIQALDLCHEYGLTPVVDFIVGLPMETDQDQRDTLRMIQYAARFGQVHVHRFLPLPGTPLARTVPRSLLPEVDRTLGRLALSGALTGTWRYRDTIL